MLFARGDSPVEILIVGFVAVGIERRL